MKNLIVAVAFMCFLPSGVRGEMTLGVNQKIELILQKIDAQGTEAERVNEMSVLLEYLADLDRNSILLVSDATVDRIASLLRIDGRMGRSFGARALAELGCRARRALPELKEIEREAEASLPYSSSRDPLYFVRPANSSVADLHDAIQKIENSKLCD